MDQSNLSMQSQYPEPEPNQLQPTTWSGRGDMMAEEGVGDSGDGEQRRIIAERAKLLSNGYNGFFKRTFDPSVPVAAAAERSSGAGRRNQNPAKRRKLHSDNQHEFSQRAFNDYVSGAEERPDSAERSQNLTQSIYPSLDPQLGSFNQPADTFMTGTEFEREAVGGWSRELPGDDIDDFLDEDNDDPDYRDHQASLKKLRTDIENLRHGPSLDDDDIDLSSILDGTSMPRRKAQQREPRPRGRQPGQKVGPRKAAELSGDIKLRLAKAVALYEAENYVEVVGALFEIIRINAEVPAAWSLLGSIYEHDGQISRALRCMIYAAHVSPKHPGPWVAAANLAEEQEGLRRSYYLMEAQYCYGHAIRADPRNLDYRRSRAAILAELGHRNTAIKEYKNIVSREPTDTEALLRIAELCIDHGKCQIAIDVYKESIAHFRSLQAEQAAAFDWTQVDTYITLYEILGQFYSAIAELKSLSRWLLGREEESFWDQITENDCEWDVDDTRKISVVGFVSGQHPSALYELPLEFRVKLGLYRLNIRQHDEAMYHLNFLDPLDKLGEHKNLDYPHLFLQAGDQLFRSELFDKALSFFEPLTELPEYSDSTLLVKIGRCLLRTQKQAHAEQTFQDAIELDDNNIEARMELAKILEAKNELHKALNLVNEVMLLRRGRYKGHADDDDDYDDGDEDHSREEGKEKVKRAPRPRVPREPKEPGVEKQVKANKRLMILSKGEELINHYQVFRSEQEGMKSGNSVATTAWLEAAKALTDDFRSCKAFYPWDKYIKFMGYSGDSVLHAATPLDADLTAIADRLSKNLGADLSLNKKNSTGKIPTTYRELPFCEWLNIFMEYAMCLAKHGRAHESYEICGALDDAVVFYHSREDKFLTHLCWSVCALISNDEEACVTQARFFMKEYQFTTDSYRMYGALMRAIHSPISWYSSGPSQKYVLRQIKCMDLALVDEERRKRNNVGEKGSYSAVDEKGHLIINDDMDVCLLMLYGHILYTGQSYAYALNYFLRAYALDPENPMINLCIGLSYTHNALKRQCENRQHHILQGMTFMMRYYDSRVTSSHLEERQEAHYNIARIYHMLGLCHLALPYYQKVLDEIAEDGKRSEREDLVVDTAYNLQTMFAMAGNMDLAREVTRRWLVI